MEFIVYRDIHSIAFIRCLSPIPGTTIHAEGTGFSMTTAIEKCRSECKEAIFQLTHPDGARMIGIAAHPNPIYAAENAWNETLETLLLQKLKRSPLIFGFKFRIGETKLLLGRIEDRFFAMAIFFHRRQPTATQAVSRDPLRALLKAWSERRNLAIYDPRDLNRYTKAYRLLTSVELTAISSRFSPQKNTVNLGGLKQFQHQSDAHTITYYLQETS